MKTHISFYAIALTALLSFSGCAASDSGALSDFAQDSQIESEVSSTEQASTEQASTEQTTTVQTTTAQTSADQTASTEPVAPEESGQSVSESEPRTISTENFTFVDYGYISDISGIFDPSECAWAAEPALDFMKSAEPQAEISFNCAYVYDFDGDGREEAFTTVCCNFPAEEDVYTEPATYLIYVNADGQAELGCPKPYYCITSVDLLDYGAEKHLVVNAYGTVGATTHSTLVGAAEGHSVVFLDERVSFSKNEFLVTVWGWQCAGGLLTYDINEHEYLSVVGKLIDFDEFCALDSTGVLSEDGLMDEVNPKEVRLLGNKFYLFGKYDYFGVLKFTYENGALVPFEGDSIRNPMFGNAFEEVCLEDFDAAVSAMKQPC